METLSKTKILIFFMFNIVICILLYIIPINTKLLENICIFKQIIGKPCWNCGMTRAFLSILHFNFAKAYQLNHNVIIVFPLTIGIYLYSWYKYIFFKKRKTKK